MDLPLNLRAESELASDFEFVTRVSKLQNYDLARITRKVVQKTKIQVEAAEFNKAQFLRFFALSSHLGVSISPSVGIDIFWHEFILYTKEYHEFCKEICGYFFHHEPFDDDTPVSLVNNTSSGEELIARHFIVEPDVTVRKWSNCASP